MSFIVSLNRNDQPLEQQLAKVATEVSRLFPGYVQVQPLRKLGMLRLKFSQPVTLGDVRKDLEKCTSIKDVDEDFGVALAPYEIDQ